MRTLLVIILLLLMALPATAIDEDELAWRLYEEANAYGSKHLDNDWETYYLVLKPTSVVINWNQPGLSAIVSVEQIFFASEDSDERYFEEESYFAAIFANYAPFEMQAECEADNVTLRQFLGSLHGEPYTLQHYLWEIAPLEFRSLSLHFPEQHLDELESTAENFFPDFTSCPED